MTVSDLAELWSVWAFVPILMALLVGLFRLKKLDNSQQWIGYLLAISLIVQIGASIFWNLEWNNLPLLHLYTPIEFFLLVGFYRSIENTPKVKNWLWLISIALAVSALINALFVQSIYEFNTLIRGAESLMLVLLSIRTWAIIIRELKIKKLTDAPVFWFNSAVLIYFSVNLILFLFNNQLNRLPEETVLLPWLVHALFMTIYYTLLAVGLWKRSKD